jgi:ubiquinol-cytochrome c reductase cytochrome b subunit
MANAISNVINAGYEWFNERAPGATAWYNRHVGQYYAPKNFNFWYYFGSLAMVVFANQILTGIWLTMHFKPDAMQAFDSIEYIRRDVSGGWLIQTMHAVGASLFFIVVYLHMFRAMLYGSYRKPRELIWVLGVVILLVLMGEAFFGYVLPWGQMSYWGAQVITSLFGSVPVIGPDLLELIRGDYVIADATLNRFFALHVIALPLVLSALIYLHLMALHEVGSNNPDGIEIKKKKDANGKPLDGIPFHPYYTVKDLFGTCFFLLIAAFIVFFAPTMGGWFLEHDNFIAANPMVTPELIKPVWYFTPYYAMLRAVPAMFGSQFPGVAVMGGAVLILFLLPWIDRSPVKSIRYRSTFAKVMLALFVVNFIWLGYCGTQHPTDLLTFTARIGTVFYFAFFIFMPWWSRIGAVKPEPERVTFDH